ncbi:DUF1403 family protein [uncultured Boseongicola sp.]|uniref:DUF1403 family protein n=1 Tax=uncultured Boseongicola sp. TaxID=1648499 RepID=UPI00263573AE|nr:DUF1403 family protein [uncultured Boseongicola sp.]
MKATANPNLGDIQALHLLPRWVTSAPRQNTDSATFSSGAALALLDVVVRDPSGILPAALLRDRLALEAAAACLKLEGRFESTSDIRDAVCLVRAGDALGPAGEMFVRWRKIARVNLSVFSWLAQVRKLLPDRVAEDFSELGVFDGSPVAQAAGVLADALQRFPREEAAALMLADVALARAVGWERSVPILAAHLNRADVRAIADGASDARLRVDQAMIDACDAAIRNAADLSRRAARLNAIAPKLRTKGAGDALVLFLGHDAVSPSGMLSPMIQGTTFAMTGRAARRLCDRLVDLGVVRELTGRSTFRLYGV